MGTKGQSHADAVAPKSPMDPIDRMEQEACGEWLRQTLQRAILEHRPRLPGWGLLRPHQIVGEYSAEADYLLLVFDQEGRPHTRRFSESDIHRLKTTDRVEVYFRNLIESFCSNG